MPYSLHAPEAARVALLALVLCAACARPAPPPPLPDPSTDPLSAMRDRLADVHTLRAQFSATAETSDGARNFDGVLLARRPDALRLRLIAPLGLTFFDYVRRDGAAWLWIPGDAGSAPKGLVMLDHLALDDVPPTVCTRLPDWAEPVTYRCPVATGTRRLRFDPGSATLRRIVDETGDKPELERVYTDYRTADGILLPYRIQLSGVARIKVDVRITRWEVNPALPADAFRPPAGATPWQSPRVR